MKHQLCPRCPYMMLDDGHGGWVCTKCGSSIAATEQETPGRYGPACGCDRNVTPKMGGESECLRHGIQPTVFIPAEQETP